MVQPSKQITISVDMPDAEIVWHVQRRDSLAEIAFEVLFMRYRRSIFAHLQHLVGDRGAAEDLSQEAFTAAWISIKNMDKELAFNSWIHRIAANKAIDYLRHQKKIQFSALPEDEPKEYQVQRPLASEEPGAEEIICDRDSVEQLLKQVSPQARACLLLHVQWGFSQKEIAEILDLPDPRRVNDYIRRARQPLRHLYSHLLQSQLSKGKRSEEKEVSTRETI